jgi:hypothetical protein
LTFFQDDAEQKMRQFGVYHDSGWMQLNTAAKQWADANDEAQ